MTNHPSCRSAAIVESAHTPTSAHALADRVAALELMLQQLVFVLDAQGALKTEGLDRWLRTAVERMHATGSVPTTQAHALATLARQVQQ